MAKVDLRVATLQGLPGVRGRGKLRALMVSSVAGVFNALKTYRACSMAGDHGSISVYIDDTGSYRAYFSQWMSIKASVATTSKAELRRWLVEHFPMMRDAIVTAA